MTEKLRSVERELLDMRADVRELRAELRQINDDLNSAKGGWRAILFIVGISATIGGVLAKIFPYLVSGPRP